MAITTNAIENKLKRVKDTQELRELIKDLPKTSFCVRISELCEEHGIKSFAEILNKDVGIVKSHFYAIMNGTRRPQKHQIIKIGIAMELTLEEVNELLKLAGHKELYVKNESDMIIIYGITNRLSKEEIEELLSDINSDFSLFEK